MIDEWYAVTVSGSEIKEWSLSAVVESFFSLAWGLTRPARSSLGSNREKIESRERFKSPHNGLPLTNTFVHSLTLLILPPFFICQYGSYQADSS